MEDCTVHAPISFASVLSPTLRQGTATDTEGFFQLKAKVGDTLVVQVSSIGYSSTSVTYLVQAQDNQLSVCLEPAMQNIEEISVIAEEKQSLETSSVISKDALTHLQPTSLADVMELLPGGTSSDIDLTGMQLIALREVKAAIQSIDTQYDYNSSFGTSFMVDGQLVSNEAQMQNITGYSEGTDLDIHQTNTTGKGIDMRMLSTDNIESIEIIRGIPSVRYGDLTSGVVLINRNYKAGDWKGRYKAQPGSKLFALGKGLHLFKSQTLNLNLDYLNYQNDPRDAKKNYARMTGSLRYQNQLKGDNRLVVIQGNMDYTGSFDEKRLDPEIDHEETDSYEEDYNKLQGGGRIHARFFNSWLKELEFSVTGSYTHTEMEVSRAVTGKLQPITTSLEEGEYYGSYLPGSYVANYKNEGKPVHFSTYVNGHMVAFIGGVEQQLLVGANYGYDKNFGEGEVYDATRPLYAGTGRTRAPKDVPAMQKLAVYIEDEFEIPIKGHRLEVKAGVRASASLHMDQGYYINNKAYFDPRLNAAWVFPGFHLFNQDVTFSLNGGFGWQTKFPALTHLYPPLKYIDKVQLNYYSQNENLRQIQYKTEIIDVVNDDLRPNRNRKQELGFRLSTDKMKFHVLAFHEESNKGFKSQREIAIIDYKLYDVSSGPDPATLSAPPTVDMFDYEERQVFEKYSKYTNGAREIKKGIEYQLDLGRMEAIQSRVSINGAYLYNKYELSQGRYVVPQVVLGDKDYPYYGYYLWDDGKTYKQFNTNIRFDTQMEELGLIFSITVQNMWFTDRKYNDYDGMPEYYYSYDQVAHPYLPAYKDDPILGFLYDEDNTFKNNRIPYEGTLNLKVTKLIGKRMKLAFYVNRLLYYAPDYSQAEGFTISRYANPYFGMELNIKL